MAFHAVIVIIGHGPIMREFFARSDIPHRHENDMSQHADVWFTRVIAEDHAALAFLFCYRADVQVFADLNFCRANLWLQLFQCCAVKDVATLDADNFVFEDVLFCKQSATLDRAGVYNRFW